MKITDFPPHKPRQIFEYFVPEKFLIGVVKAIIEQYKHTKWKLERESLGFEEKRYLAPHLRRTYIESAFSQFPRRFKNEKVQVTCRENSSKDSHRIIVCGPILLTQSKVDRRSQLPREAEFRRTYAESPQLNLFDTSADEFVFAENDEDTLFAIITHKPAENMDQPEFVDVIFPDKNYTRIIDRIRLFDKYPTIVNGTVSDDTENKTPPIELLPKKSTG